MSKNTMSLSLDHSVSLAAILHAQLTSLCGENWEKEFAADRKDFVRPVKANLYLDTRRKKKLSRSHVINMILSKIHDKSPEKIVELLESIDAISSGEAMKHFNRIKDSMSESRRSMVESILLKLKKAA